MTAAARRLRRRVDGPPPTVEGVGRADGVLSGPVLLCFLPNAMTLPAFTFNPLRNHHSL
jgi:hypothetical protein